MAERSAARERPAALEAWPAWPNNKKPQATKQANKQPAGDSTSAYIEQAHNKSSHDTKGVACRAGHVAYVLLAEVLAVTVIYIYIYMCIVLYCIVL